MDLWSMLGEMSQGSLGGAKSASMNESSGGFRTMIDIAQRNQIHNMGDIVKNLMTNAPSGVAQFTKGPWNFNG